MKWKSLILNIILNNNILFDLYFKHNLHPLIKNNGSIIKHIYYSYSNENKKKISIIINEIHSIVYIAINIIIVNIAIEYIIIALWLVWI